MKIYRAAEANRPPCFAQQGVIFAVQQGVILRVLPIGKRENRPVNGAKQKKNTFLRAKRRRHKRPCRRRQKMMLTAPQECGLKPIFLKYMDCACAMYRPANRGVVEK